MTRVKWQENDPLEMLAEQEKGEAIKKFSLAMMETRYCRGCGHVHPMPVSGGKDSQPIKVES